VTIISHRHRFVFIAVPKSASHSIRFAVRDQLGPQDEEQVALFVRRRIERPEFAAVGHGHQLAREVRAALGVTVWEQYCSFAVVRNPWERLVSYAAFMMRFNGLFVQDPLGTLRWMLANPDQQSPPHFRAQSDYLTDDAGQLIVQHVCRAETLQADFAAVCAVTGLAPRVLEVRNPSEHRHYTEYYDAALAQAVGEHYREDVERFGYRFGD
jgi:hypothetical protein